MPGRLRSRKRKSSESRGSAKACPAQMSCSSPVESKAFVSGSEISCECEHWSTHRRCSASPPPPSPPPPPPPPLTDDKENQQEALSAVESMDCEDCSKTLFPDDDSNEVLPVEQFFGNMDTVQDFPQRSSGPSTSAQRAVRRRRFYAPEDSEEEVHSEEEVYGQEEGGLRPQQRH